MAFEKNTYAVALDIKRHHGASPKVLSVSGDTANRIVVTVENNHAPMDLAGLYVRAVFQRSDGRVVLQAETDTDDPITADKSNGVVTIDVKNGSYRDGDNYMEIQILSDDPDTGTVMSTTSRLLIRARNCIMTDEATEASTEYGVLAELVNALRNMGVTVTTLAPMQNATATLALENGAYHLALGIPRGASIIGITYVPSDNALVADRLRFVFDNGTVLLCDVPRFATQEWVLNKDYATTAAVSEAIAAIQEALTMYATVQYVANAIRNSGHYVKPRSGIPRGDLAADVVGSLDLADTALQAADLDGYATETWVEGKGYLTAPVQAASLASAVQLALARANSALQSIPDDSISTEKLQAEAVTNATLAKMPAKTIKGNDGNASAVPQDLTVAEILAMFPFLGASIASNGRAGFVTQPLIGDQDKFLKGDGTWATPSGGGTVTDKVFVATYNTTTAADINAARSEGKVVAVYDPNGRAMYAHTSIGASRVSGAEASFFGVDASSKTLYNIYVVDTLSGSTITGTTWTETSSALGSDKVELFVSDSPVTPTPTEVRAADAAGKIPVITDGLHYYFPVTINANECVFFTAVSGEINELYWDTTTSMWAVTIYNYVPSLQPTANAVLVTGSDRSVTTKTVSAFLGDAGALTLQTVNASAGAVTATLNPNTVTVFTGELTSLTLTPGAPVEGIANIYQVFFKNGATAVTLSMPSNVIIDAAFAPEAGAWTELSIQYIYSVTEGGVTTHYYIARGGNVQEVSV